MSGNKSRKLISAMLAGALISTLCLAGCKGKTIEVVPESDETLNNVVVGFSQLGAESDWRSANTASMKQAFSEKNGYTLIFEDGQQKQSNQITAIRSFIQQEVDYIVLAPVTETGWDTVLQEAKEAGIPVIIVDRQVDVNDQSLFTCWVGSDFELEGKKMAEWLHDYAMINHIADEDIHIVNIQGTEGSSSQIGRTKGIENAAAKYGWDLMAEESGEYTQAKGREVMVDFLRKYPELNVVYCENDNEAYGAIEAIEAAGKKVGSNIKNGEIMVLSFDAVDEKALRMCADGQISCIAECNPLHGPRVLSIIETLESGGIPNKFSYVYECIFSSHDYIKELAIDGEKYPVTLINDEVIRQRIE